MAAPVRPILAPRVEEGRKPTPASITAACRADGPQAGAGCVFDAVASAFKATNGPVKWSDVKAHVKGEQCLRGVTYADQITSKYFNFPP